MERVSEMKRPAKSPDSKWPNLSSVSGFYLFNNLHIHIQSSYFTLETIDFGRDQVIYSRYHSRNLLTVTERMNGNPQSVYPVPKVEPGSS